MTNQAAILETIAQERQSAEEFLTKAQGAKKRGDTLGAMDCEICAKLCMDRVEALEREAAANEGVYAK